MSGARQGREFLLTASSCPKLSHCSSLFKDHLRSKVSLINLSCSGTKERFTRLVFISNSPEGSLYQERHTKQGRLTFCERQDKVLNSKTQKCQTVCNNRIRSADKLYSVKAFIKKGNKSNPSNQKITTEEM